MKSYILSYTFNGVDHVAEVDNISDTFSSLCVASMVGSVEHVTLTNKRVI